MQITMDLTKDELASLLRGDVSPGVHEDVIKFLFENIDDSEKTEDYIIEHSHRISHPVSGFVVNVYDDVFNIIQKLLLENKKIAAIKILRLFANLPLKEAKEMVESKFNFKQYDQLNDAV